MMSQQLCNFSVKKFGIFRWYLLISWLKSACCFLSISAVLFVTALDLLLGNMFFSPKNLNYINSQNDPALLYYHIYIYIFTLNQSPSLKAYFISKLKTSKTMSRCVAQGLIIDHDFLIIEQISYLVYFVIFKLEY